MKYEKKEESTFLEESKFIGQRIRIARLLTNLSRSDFCYKHNINPYTLTSLELGRVKLTNQKKQQLLIAFYSENVICTAEWILEGKGTPAYQFQENNFTQISINSSHNIKDKNVFSIFQEIETFRKGSDRAIITLIQDDAMLPWYKPGDYVGGKLIDEQNISDLIGEICLVEVESEKFVVRYLSQGEDYFILSSTNPHSRLCIPLFIKSPLMRVAKIFWHRKPE